MDKPKSYSFTAQDASLIAGGKIDAKNFVGNTLVNNSLVVSSNEDIYLHGSGLYYGVKEILRYK